MKQIIGFFSLVLILLSSCNEHKKETGITAAVEPTINNDSTETNVQQISNPKTELYQLSDLEEYTGQKVAFISFSDNYPLSQHKDSLAIPNMDSVKDKKALQYFQLDKEYRSRFLNKTGILETDSIYIYDYTVNRLRSFLVRSLNVAANLNVYSDDDNYPKNQYDYEIGLEIEKKLLWQPDHNYAAFAFAGKQNPFVAGQMKPIVWQKMKLNEFPFTKSNLPKATGNIKDENSYMYNSDKYQYFVYDYKEAIDDYFISRRQLIVIDNQNKKAILDRLFSDGESTFITSLNFGIDNPSSSDIKEQWTGTLLKDKPEVIFGFEGASFGCPNIIFIHPQEKDIYINCDNRH